MKWLIALVALIAVVATLILFDVGPFATRADNCRGHNCTKSYTMPDAELTILSCGSSAADAGAGINEADRKKALRDKVKAECGLVCSDYCCPSGTCTDGWINTHTGILLAHPAPPPVGQARGWTCTLVGPDDLCRRSQQMYSCEGKFDSQRSTAFCRGCT